MCVFKKEAEKELRSELWDRVAAKMVAYHPHSEHNPKSLRKRYAHLVSSGFLKEQLSPEDTEVVSDLEGTSAASFDVEMCKAGKQEWADVRTTTTDVSMQDLESKVLLQRVSAGTIPFSWLDHLEAENETTESFQLPTVATPLVNYESDE